MRHDVCGSHKECESHHSAAEFLALVLARCFERASTTKLTSNAPSPAIRSLSILINEVAEMENVIYGMLAGGISKGIEEAEVVVAARVNSQRDCYGLVIFLWGCLRFADRAAVARVAHSELVVVCSVRRKASGFNLVHVSAKTLKELWDTRITLTV